MKSRFMLQKAQSNTTSSNSATNSKSRTSDLPGAKLGLRSETTYLKGVGPRVAQLLQAKGIKTLEDLIWHLPRDYQDRSRMKKIMELAAGERALVRATVTRHRFIPIRRFSQPLLEAHLEDGSGRTLLLKWFRYNRKFFEGKFSEKPTLVVYGQVKSFGHNFEIIHPDIDWSFGSLADTSAERVLPVYSEIEGVHQKLLRKIIAGALDAAGSQIEEDIPRTVLQGMALPSTKDAIHFLHRPPKSADTEKLQAFATESQRLLIMAELFKFEWIVGQKRVNIRREPTKGFPKNAGLGLLGEMERRLPFELTGDQKAAIQKIYDVLAETKPMNRLLQGDVGCGKTLVALACALPVVAGGAQAVVMAPTEILAEQHLKTAKNVLEGLPLPKTKSTLFESGLRCGLLTGSTPKSARDEILQALADGSIHVLIGTHAVFEDPVAFKNLGLVIVDEQHRFGVDQRMKLRAKGKHPPHTLSMTATPIPRTLALTAYGDLDVTTIKELPKGRPEIVTKVLRNNQREKLFDALRAELQKGRQAYVIFPLVEESEKMDLKNAVDGAEELANGALEGFRVGLLHGRMKGKEKSEIMNQFKAGKIQVLVSTTVVEVGVDVPNATALVIEHAERFGLSQLHQLRGRIGRGTETSHCFLMTNAQSGNAYDRLCAMEQTRDGFKLAELDLEMRGPGEFLGTKQSGELQFKFANLIRDKELLLEARKAAFALLAVDPDLRLPENEPLRKYMIRAGHLSQSRYETA